MNTTSPKIYLALLVACCASVSTPVSAADEPKVANRWALLVGVDDYAYAQKLNYCGADQQALSQRLIAAGFPEDHVFALYDKAENARLKPSLGNIERQLNLVLSLAEEDDLVVIGFSGHGVHLNGKSYLCPADCTLDDPSTLIGVDALYDRLKDCSARFKLVVVDACRNDPRPGGARSMTATDGTRALGRTLQDLKVPEGVVLLNSCAPGEVSWEDEKFGHGVFMHFVLDGLGGAADSNGDGAVSLSELQSHAGTKTKTYVANRFAFAQRPFFKGDLSTEALQFALLPVPGGVRTKAERYDPSKPVTIGAMLESQGLRPYCWHVLRGSPAHEAGLRTDDLLISVGGQPVANSEEAYAAIGAFRPGDTIDLVVERGPRRMTISVVGEARSDEVIARLLKSSAEEGVPAAMLQLGRYHLWGGNSEIAQDEATGVDWLRRAADTGDAEALYYLATAYDEGWGVEKDPAAAVPLVEKALDAVEPLSHDGAHGKAASLLGDLYWNGRGVAQNKSKGLALWQEAAKAGHPRAAWVLGLKYRDGDVLPNDYSKAMEMFQQAAAAHLGDAEFSIALMFDNGLGVSRDTQSARVWYERAAEREIPGAMSNLAILLENGEGGPRDTFRAAALYRKSMEAGNVIAMRNLGLCYQHGTGVARDYAEAMKLFRAAAAKGNMDAEIDIGLFYERGWGVDQDYVEARRHYEVAAAAGEATAQNNLGILYREGRGVRQDYARAMQYFQQAAKQKHPGAMLNIGALIYSGQGVQKDLATARGWYEAAADRGESIAMFNLGIMLEYGEGGPKNETEAYNWYRKSAALGYEKARDRLK